MSWLDQIISLTRLVILFMLDDRQERRYHKKTTSAARQKRAVFSGKKTTRVPDSICHPTVYSAIMAYASSFVKPPLSKTSITAINSGC
jgi:hypothetical protein